MKTFIVACSLLAQMVCAGMALAVPVTVDFASAGIGQDIIKPGSATIGDVTMSYDDFGSGTEIAFVDAGGIFGTTFGALIFDFSRLTTALNLDFSLLDLFSDVGEGSPVADSLIAIFARGDNQLESVSVPADFFAYDPLTDPTLGSASGALAFNGPAFDHVEMYFLFDAPFFTVANVSYEPVPEPATFVLFAAGLLGLCVWRYIRHKGCKAATPAR